MATYQNNTGSPEAESGGRTFPCPAGLLFAAAGEWYFFIADANSLVRLPHSAAAELRRLITDERPISQWNADPQAQAGQDPIGLLVHAIDRAAATHQPLPQVPPAVMPRIWLRHVGIVSTWACNMRCTYCFLHSLPTQSVRQLAVMSDVNATRAVDGLILGAPSGSEVQFDFMGGEPLLTPRIIRTVLARGQEQALRRNVRIRWMLTTNGLELTSDIVDLLAQHRVEVHVSLDGPERVHNAFRKLTNEGNAHARTERNLRHALQSYPEGMHVNVTVTNETVRHWQETIDYLRDFTCPKRLTFGYEDTAAKPDAEARDYVINQFLLGDQLGDDFSLMGVTEKLGLLRSGQTIHYGCPALAGISTVYVDPLGNVYPCYNLFDQKAFLLGHVSCFENVQREQKTRHRFILTDVSSQAGSACHTCWARFICAGECPARNNNLFGSLLPPSMDTCIARLKHYESLVKAYARKESCELPDLMSLRLQPI